MATNFPTSLDTLSTSRGTTGEPLSNHNHITHHTNEDDAVAALEAKVGVDSSAVTSSLDYKLKNTASSDPGHKHTTSSLSDFNISAPATNDFLVYTGGKWTNTAKANISYKFGGTGVDGALSITSGTQNIDCANAAVVIKNYTSISITGTGKLTFTNPNTNGTTVIFRTTGNTDLTSSQAPMIDMSSMGAAGGAGAISNNGGAIDGSAGNNGISFSFLLAGGGGGAGAAGAAIVFGYQSSNNKQLIGKYPQVFVGAGGGGGRANAGAGQSATGGTGGRGGGGLIIECSGAFNFTTASGISVAGATGTNGSNSGVGNSYGAGGGGGSGGFCAIFYNTLTANSGTITVTAGSGGSTSGSGGVVNGGGGGGATVAGSANSSGNGGTGAVGLSSVVANTEFV